MHLGGGEQAGGGGGEQAGVVGGEEKRVVGGGGEDEKNDGRLGRDAEGREKQEQISERSSGASSAAASCIFEEVKEGASSENDVKQTDQERGGDKSDVSSSSSPERQPCMEEVSTLEAFEQTANVASLKTADPLSSHTPGSSSNPSSPPPDLLQELPSLSSSLLSPSPCPGEQGDGEDRETNRLLCSELKEEERAMEDQQQAK